MPNTSHVVFAEAVPCDLVTRLVSADCALSVALAWRAAIRVKRLEVVGPFGALIARSTSHVGFARALASHLKSNVFSQFRFDSSVFCYEMYQIIMISTSVPTSLSA